MSGQWRGGKWQGKQQDRLEGMKHAVKLSTSAEADTVLKTLCVTVAPSCKARIFIPDQIAIMLRAINETNQEICRACLS